MLGGVPEGSQRKNNYFSAGSCAGGWLGRGASYHRPSLQTARVSLGGRSPFLAVHDIPEVEQVRRSLAIESARGQRLRRRGTSFHGALLSHRIGCSGRLGWPRLRSCLRFRLGDRLHPDLGLDGARCLILGPSRSASAPLGWIVRSGLGRSVCQRLLLGRLRLRIFCNCCFQLGHF